MIATNRQKKSPLFPKKKKRTLKNGRGARDRTEDPLIKSQLLYQLSYTPTKKMEQAKGIEPSTTTLARWNSTIELSLR
jgi:hypothetical protein